MYDNQGLFSHTIKFIGNAGEGILTVSEMLLSVITDQGIFGSVYREYPSNIRGGYTSSTVKISNVPINSPVSSINCLFIRSIDSLINEIPNCKKNATLLFDTSECSIIKVQEHLKCECRDDIVTIPMHLQSEIRKHIFLKHFSTIILGIFGNYLSIQQHFLIDTLRKKFKNKESQFIKHNIELLLKVYSTSTNLFKQQRIVLPKSNYSNAKLSCTDGNNTISQAAITSGCSFFASYPITPATGIGNILALKLADNGGSAYQAEDEIAAIGAAVGASFTGAKSMTATSGPGLSLMQEFIGYASMIELPLVIIDVQRSGPSTGAPTKFSQDDLFAAVMGSHGESPRIVLAPISVEDCYTVTIEAFNCAEYYQCPVILLSDSIIATSKKTVAPFSRYKSTIYRDVYNNKKSKENPESDCYPTVKEESFKRYKLSSNGINQIPIPGISPVSYCATGVEHDETGAPTDSPEMQQKQHEKRYHKISTIEHKFQNLLEWDYNDLQPDIAIISWGISASIMKDALFLLRTDGIRVIALYPRILFPVCTDAINNLLSCTNHLIVAESNQSGQYAKILRMQTDAKPYSITSYNGLPFTPEKLYQDIITLINKWTITTPHVYPQLI